MAHEPRVMRNETKGLISPAVAVSVLAKTRLHLLEHLLHLFAHAMQRTGTERGKARLRLEYGGI